MNKARNDSFARVNTKQKTVANMEWCTYKQNLLLRSNIRTTMTTQEQESASLRRIILPIHCRTNFINLFQVYPTLDSNILPKVDTEQLNFGHGTVIWYVEKNLTIEWYNGSKKQRLRESRKN